METCIYFDNAATTFPKPECVYEAMDNANRNYAVNAGRGSYSLGKMASEIIASTKDSILNLIKANSVAEVVLTASATIASNQILGGIRWNKEMVVYVSPYEHNATMRVLHMMQVHYDFTIEELPMKEGSYEIDLQKTEFLFTRKKPHVLVMSHVSNVIGCIVPIKELAELAKQYQALVVVDGAQALGLIPFELRQTKVDFYIFAGHKTPYGPLGIGGYINNSGYELATYIAGGTGSDSLNLDMNSQEPGSPNIIAIAGLQAALEELNPEVIFEREQQLTQLLIQKLKKIDGIDIYDIESKQQVGIVAFNIQGYQAADVGMILDEDYNIAVRTGYQCAPLIHKYLQSEQYHGVVRASMGQFTTEEEIDLLVKAVKEITEG